MKSWLLKDAFEKQDWDTKTPWQLVLVLRKVKTNRHYVLLHLSGALFSQGECMNIGKTVITPSILLLALLSTSVLAEYYKVNVKRVEQNLYKTDSGLYIQTKYCYEYAYGEEAVLKYEDYSYDNKLVFDSGTTCDVEKVFK